ncbi:MAG: hypothetical protein AB7T22_17055 [Calditrichaceae bacterium]
MSVKRGIIICLTGLLFVFCDGKSDENKASEDELYFNIDKSLLEDAVKPDGYHISLNPPKNWLPVNEELFDALVKETTKLTDPGMNIEYKPITIFFDEQYGNLLSVIHVKTMSDSVSGKAFEQKYIAMLDHNLPSAEPQKGSFTKNDTRFTQYLIQDDKRVAFKLIFLDLSGQVIQLDYNVDANRYIHELKAIESSIGSVSLY